VLKVRYVQPAEVFVHCLAVGNTCFSVLLWVVECPIVDFRSCSSC
jgi:hypothetical protein